MNRAHNPKVSGSNPDPATKTVKGLEFFSKPFLFSFVLSAKIFPVNFITYYYRTLERYYSFFD